MNVCNLFVQERTICFVQELAALLVQEHLFLLVQEEALLPLQDEDVFLVQEKKPPFPIRGNVGKGGNHHLTPNSRVVCIPQFPYMLHLCPRCSTDRKSETCLFLAGFGRLYVFICFLGGFAPPDLPNKSASGLPSRIIDVIVSRCQVHPIALLFLLFRDVTCTKFG